MKSAHVLVTLVLASTSLASAQTSADLTRQLQTFLAQHKFTGRIESTLPKRLGRNLDPRKVEAGRLLFFDKFLGLHGDNTCAGCHSPNHALGDSQSIAIGVDSNDVVGKARTGPRNQRRTPSVINTAFYPKLMWNGRFSVVTGDPFNNSRGFVFPDPEGTTRFPAGDARFKHLLVAQAHIPPTELPEMAGFTGYGRTTIQLLNSAGSSSFDFSAFDSPARSWAGTALPPPIVVQRAGPSIVFDEFRNEPIRHLVMARINANDRWSSVLLGAFPEVDPASAIPYDKLAQALAEFEMSLTFTNAPIDRFARGETTAMSDSQKRGANLFFDKANCVKCHAVSGSSNEMFSDFANHVAAIPHIAPKFGKTTGNVLFRDATGEFTPKGNQDWGLADFTGASADAYKFRTSPLRNVGLQPTFFHNGAFTRLEDAVKYHINTVASAKTYSATDAGVAADLRINTGDISATVQRIDPLLKTAVALSANEFADLVCFLRESLTDDRARPENLRRMIPTSVPSGLPMSRFGM
jgi:cytochrome c peroxidase